MLVTIIVIGYYPRKFDPTISSIMEIRGSNHQQYYGNQRNIHLFQVMKKIYALPYPWLCTEINGVIMRAVWFTENLPTTPSGSGKKKGV